MIEEYREMTSQLSNRDKLLEAQRLVAEVDAATKTTWKNSVVKGRLGYVSSTILDCVNAIR